MRCRRRTWTACLSSWIFTSPTPITRVTNSCRIKLMKIPTAVCTSTQRMLNICRHSSIYRGFVYSAPTNYNESCAHNRGCSEFGHNRSKYQHTRGSDYCRCEPTGRRCVGAIRYPTSKRPRAAGCMSPASTLLPLPVSLDSAENCIHKAASGNSHSSFQSNLSGI
jgi:hypothetical protein